MTLKKSPWIWMDGEYIPWDEAQVHVLSHSLHYGCCVFEGIRAYNTAQGAAIFRVDAHIRRLYNSARIHEMEIPIPESEMIALCHELLARNSLTNAYIRPLIYYGYGGLGLLAPEDSLRVSISTFEWGNYLGDDSKNHGVAVGVSSWRRFAPDTMPAQAKAGGNYISSQLITREAQRNGFDEGVALDYFGNLSEGPGMNLFLVRDGALLTPTHGDSILDGITRDSVICLADDLGIEVLEQTMPREYLYLADEIFFTGTAAEIVPIRTVDGRNVGNGKPGPMTRQLQHAFYGILEGSRPDTRGWLQRP
ncbi:MAG: branched-chain amino acid transaminase [Acidobacteriota bacterium]|nr:branched-chain amino acid transaminase [Acidobacteriota bacterium]